MIELGYLSMKQRMWLFSDPQSRTYARLTGGFYLAIAVAGVFSIAYVPSQLMVTGDAQATVSNILSRRGLYQFGIGADALLMLLEIMVVAMLYFMFRHVNETLSMAAALARLSMVGVMAAMLFFHAGTLALIEPGEMLASFSADQRTDLAGLMLSIHDSGVWIWQAFFFLHLLILGQLVARSGRFPVLLGHAMTLGGFGYLVDSVHAFAAPNSDIIGVIKIGLLAVVTLAELSFALWLLLRAPADPSEKRAQTVPG